MNNDTYEYSLDEHTAHGYNYTQISKFSMNV